jgi:methylated-DNA-[protein]-cysteine S-methyltransferase
MSSLFSKKVKEVVQKIPKGETLSYKDVASLAGNINGARAVARIMSQNEDLTIPCHRVIKSDGTLAGYNGLLGKSQRELLDEEAL